MSFILQTLNFKGLETSAKADIGTNSSWDEVSRKYRNTNLKNEQKNKHKQIIE